MDELYNNKWLSLFLQLRACSMILSTNRLEVKVCYHQNTWQRVAWNQDGGMAPSSTVDDLGDGEKSSTTYSSKESSSYAEAQNLLVSVDPFWHDQSSADDGAGCSDWSWMNRWSWKLNHMRVGLSNRWRSGLIRQGFGILHLYDQVRSVWMVTEDNCFWATFACDCCSG